MSIAVVVLLIGKLDLRPDYAGRRYFDAWNEDV